MAMRLLYNFILAVQELFTLCIRAVLNLFRRPLYLRETMTQMDILGVGSILIVILTGFFAGGVLALQSAKTLKSFGAINITAQLVSISVVRELGPVLTALIAAGRIGSGISSELGSMVVTEQIDAMRALGTDPIKKLVTPRLVATTIMLPLLTIAADLAGLVGGWLVSFYTLNLDTYLYWHTTKLSLTYIDIVEGLTKPLVFGFIIGIVGCYFGLSTRGGTRGVGQSTTHAVVVASILVIVSDFFMNKLLLELRY